MDDVTSADMVAWTGRITGALTEPEFSGAFAAACLADLEVRETHRVHEHAPDHRLG
jgi:arsenite methyltransferase